MSVTVVSSGPLAKWVPLSVVAWVTFQLVLPWRHNSIPSDVNWTDEGHLPNNS